MHIQAKCSPFRNKNSTWLTTMLESIKGDEQRYRAIARAATSLTTQEDADLPLAIKNGDYVINLGFGTPQQSFYTLLDTGSDISSIPCDSGNVFNPSKSSTFQYLSFSSETCQAQGSTPNCGKNLCRVMEIYGDGSQVNSLLSNNSLTVGSHSMPGFIFGCAISRTGNMPSTPALVGFGRKSMSFVSQTTNLFNQTFSYCIPYSDSTGCLELGNDALSPAYFQFTSLSSKRDNPSFYYVGLIAITIGEQRVSVAKIDESVGGERVDLESATIIDSGTTITRLVEPFYSAVRDTFLLQFQNFSLATGSGIFDTCFNISSKYIDVPPITLNFDNYVDVALPPENYLIPVNEEGSVLCLAFAPPPVNFASGVSVVGSF